MDPTPANADRQCLQVTAAVSRCISLFIEMVLFLSDLEFSASAQSTGGRTSPG